MAEVIDKSTLKALSTETRQDIVKLLAKRPYTASELARTLGKHVTTISEHLGVLERSGVVRKKESTNKWVYYVLTDKGEKLLKPYYSWVITLSVSLLAFVVGLYEIFFVRYQATVLSISEAGRETTAVTEIQTYDTNLIAGIILIIFALLLFWYAMRKRYLKTGSNKPNMPKPRTVMKVMGVTFILTGIFFFATGMMMLSVMGAVNDALGALGAFGSEVPAMVGTLVTLGWVFSFITFAAGVFSIITAILLFVTKEE